MVTHMNRPSPRTWVTSSVRLALRVVTAVGLAAALGGPARAQSVLPPTEIGTLGGPVDCAVTTGAATATTLFFQRVVT